MFGDEAVNAQDLSVVKGRKTGPAWSHQEEAATLTSLILGTRDLVLMISTAECTKGAFVITNHQFSLKHTQSNHVIE